MIPVFIFLVCLTLFDDVYKKIRMKNITIVYKFELTSSLLSVLGINFLPAQVAKDRR